MAFRIDEKINLEQLLYSRFVKYTSLSKIIAKEFAGSSATHVNIYIDLYSLFTSLYRACKYQSAMCVSSASINYCAHLRSFFRYYGVDSDIVLVYSTNTCENNKKYIPSYNTMYQNRIIANERIYDLVIANIRVLNTLVPYLPHIYLKLGTADSSVVIKHLIDRQVLPPSSNIVISDSVAMYQLPVNTNDTIVIRKRTVGGEDCSCSYNKNDCMNWYVEESKNADIHSLGLRQSFITGMMTILGSNKLSIRAIGNINTGLRTIQSLPLGYERDPARIYEAYIHSITKSALSLQEFIQRYYGIDIVTQTALYQTMPESNTTNFLVDLYDPEAVKTINNRYFTKAPINLDKL